VQELARIADLAAEGLDDRLMISIDAPASAGRPGPGETTSCDGTSRSASSAVSSSLRRTVTSTPSAPKRCARLYVNES
jgi:hypothetical protein